MEATSKAMEDFRASEKYEKKRVEYSIDVHDAGRQSILTRVATKYLSLNLNFLDEIWDPIVADVSVAGTSTLGTVL